MRTVTIMREALVIARRVIVQVRREELASYTMYPHRGVQMREPYPGMLRQERQAMRRYDRAIAAIDEAIK